MDVQKAERKEYEKVYTVGDYAVRIQRFVVCQRMRHTPKTRGNLGRQQFMHPDGPRPPRLKSCEAL